MPNDYLYALIGGGLIGLASALWWLMAGRIAGISGLFEGALLGRSPVRGQQVAFVGGLLGVGIIASQFAPERLSLAGAPGTFGLIAAGLLVGFGTRLGGGCTSGHGVCGMGRLSKRSVVATITFMATAGVTVFVVRHILGAA